MEGDTHIIASGEKWVGSGVRSISSTVRNLIESSQESILMTVYILSDSSILEYIKNSLERGVFVEIFIYKKENFLSNMKRISDMEKEYNNLKIYYIMDMLHSKVLISDNEKLIVGSANFTANGLYRNHEVGVLIEDSEIAYEMGKLIRRLVE